MEIYADTQLCYNKPISHSNGKWLQHQIHRSDPVLIVWFCPSSKLICRLSFAICAWTYPPKNQFKIIKNIHWQIAYTYLQEYIKMKKNSANVFKLPVDEQLQAVITHLLQRNSWTIVPNYDLSYHLSSFSRYPRLALKHKICRVRRHLKAKINLN